MYDVCVMLALITELCKIEVTVKKSYNDCVMFYPLSMLMYGAHCGPLEIAIVSCRGLKDI